MAMEALKSAGIAAYQGSSRKPAVKAAEAKGKSEVSAAGMKMEKTADKVVDIVQRKPEQNPERKMKQGNPDTAGDSGKAQEKYVPDSSGRVQEKPIIREPARAPETGLPESTESIEGKLPTEALKRAVEEINKNIVDSEAVFGVHDSTNRVTIKIVDKQTKEVLKEYPPEKTLDMIAKVWELAGLLVDEKG